MTDKKDKSKDRRLYLTYGITLEEWKEKFKEQKGVCWICETLPPSGRLSVDHVHVKGFKKMGAKEKKKYVRGLLCFLCNTLIGKIERTNNTTINKKRIRRAFEYFKTYRMKGEE